VTGTPSGKIEDVMSNKSRTTAISSSAAFRREAEHTAHAERAIQQKIDRTDAEAGKRKAKSHPTQAGAASIRCPRSPKPAREDRRFSD
jgi:hypothetical protein